MKRVPSSEIRQDFRPEREAAAELVKSCGSDSYGPTVGIVQRLSARLDGFRYLRIAAFCSVVISCLPLHADDWPQFRGANSNGIGTGSPPTHFGPDKNVLWHTPIAPGHSSPCIHGGRIFLTSFNKDVSTVSVECFERGTGNQLWTATFKADAFEKGHPSFNPASSSPCCDAEHIIAYFGSYGLLCLNHDGTTVWEKRLPLTKSFGGNNIADHPRR